MANKIKIKNSVVASNVPSSLDYGELAINVNDEILFYKNSSDVIKSFDLTAIGDISSAFDTINGEVI